MLEDVKISRPMKLVIDCGNGVAAVVAPALMQALGCEVVDLFCNVDGSFPNHPPDPGKPEHLITLIKTVRDRKADLGIAFDGDGDRLVVVDSGGKIIWPDRLLMLLAKDVLSRQPGSDIIFDVKSSSHLASEILASGGRPVIWKTGHSFIKAKMKKSGALLAGEFSGHIFFKERWYGFDDALYSCARLLEILSAETSSSAEVFARLPENISTPELEIPLEKEGDGFRIMEELDKKADFGDARLIKIDGIRAEFGDGWGLVRASNTSPSLILRFEAVSSKSLKRIQTLFKQQLKIVDASLKLRF